LATGRVTSASSVSIVARFTSTTITRPATTAACSASAATAASAILHALAYGDSGDPWETDVDVTGHEPAGPPAFPVLDLSDSRDEAPLPAGPPAHEPPPDPAEYALS
jgi:hypothetical protein